MKQIHIFLLRLSNDEPQTIEMPRRARITGVARKQAAVQVFAEVEHDADTRAFDTQKHRRAFVAVTGSGAIPAQGQLVGFDGANNLHVYEVKP